MTAEAQGFVEGLKTCFAELNDPRIAASCAHSLLDILAIAVLAVTCGADDFTEMEAFGRLRRDWLKTFLELPNGIPSHDTFRRVFGLVDRKQFAACLFPWTQALHEATGGKLIYQAIEIPKSHPQRRVWRDLRTLVVVNSRRVKDGQETWETRLYISNHAPRAKPLGHAIRKHWGIENGQHWVLDIAFGEDARRQQDRTGAANLAAVRRLTVSLLRQEKSLKRGAKCKRMACALDPEYLLKVWFFRF
jgi:predicted transposase YbfD/YdcC